MTKCNTHRFQYQYIPFSIFNYPTPLKTFLQKVRMRVGYQFFNVIRPHGKTFYYR
jgi:hypothetical protein